MDVNWIEKKLRCAGHQAIARGYKWGYGWGLLNKKGVWAPTTTSPPYIFPTSIFLIGSAVVSTVGEANPYHHMRQAIMCELDLSSDSELKAIHGGFGQYSYDGSGPYHLFMIAKSIKQEFAALYVRL